MDPRVAERIARRLDDAERAFGRERYQDVARMLSPLARQAPEVAEIFELLGLSEYRLGRWRAAANALETWRHLTKSVEHHPVLADCYRALRRYSEMEVLWEELREASPSAALVAEGRIVVAGALADRGELVPAIEMMEKTARMPRRVRDHHLRCWYVLGDLYDRSGDPIRARHFFQRVADNEAEFADVSDRLGALGR
jgi:tetratricopeptide (TPR) repeat protein